MGARPKRARPPAASSKEGHSQGHSNVNKKEHSIPHKDASMEELDPESSKVDEQPHRTGNAQVPRRSRFRELGLEEDKTNETADAATSDFRPASASLSSYIMRSWLGITLGCSDVGENAKTDNAAKMSKRDPDTKPAKNSEVERKKNPKKENSVQEGHTNEEPNVNEQSAEGSVHVDKGTGNDDSLPAINSLGLNNDLIMEDEELGTAIRAQFPILLNLLALAISEDTEAIEKIENGLAQEPEARHHLPEMLRRLALALRLRLRSQHSTNHTLSTVLSGQTQLIEALKAENSTLLRTIEAQAKENKELIRAANLSKSKLQESYDKELDGEKQKFYDLLTIRNARILSLDTKVKKLEKQWGRVEALEARFEELKSKAKTWDSGTGKKRVGEGSSRVDKGNRRVLE
ncbi:hypothetical protein M501DRAFT_1017838 [Patellaria atrata CBS 101060]|uniref:Uncharacterized protein n=1 Tax=Patellaria atrata CBS 101060 TaxID=1346257 RepID=A0A9P4S7F6_9PEZI|nr:hypothetical protein M501DRAFT_1017838 [Patellaria atrata CBS 101060]